MKRYAPQVWPARNGTGRLFVSGVLTGAPILCAGAYRKLRGSNHLSQASDFVKKNTNSYFPVR